MLASASFPPKEGMGFYIWNLAHYLTQRGHNVEIITRSSPDQAFHEELAGISIWRPFFTPLYPFHVHLHALFVNRLIQRLESEVSVFHCHSPLIPPIQTTRPIMLTVHSTVRDDIRATRFVNWNTLLMKLQAPISFQLEVLNLKAAREVNAVSPRVAAALRRYPHCPGQVPVVWNGVDADLFTPGDGPREGFLLSVGRLGPGKGFEDLIEALGILASQHISVPLVVIGDGSSKQILEERAKAHGLGETVRFLGHVSDRAHLVDLYQKAALFVLPSHHEGLPTVILEAMACGCPVLSTDVGGVSSVVEDNVNGALTPCRNPQRLALAIQSLLADPGKLAQMGVRARVTVEERFSWGKIGSMFEARYSDLWKMPGSRVRL